MGNLNGGLSGSGTLRGTLGGGGVPAQDVYWDDILNKPNFAAVATSGSYNDLVNKPNLANVATSGSYNDLTDKPTIPAAQVNADWNATSGVAEVLNKPTLAPVATSGSYNDLTNTPTIPAAQVNADWNAASGVAAILNKPTIPAAQVNADWNATSGVAEILNKPTIPTTASQIDYNNTTSGLQADDVQDAITELKSNLTELQYNNIGAAINLTADTDYVTLSDGYFVLTFNGGDVSGNHYAYGNVDGVKLIALNSPKTVATFGYEATAVYVRKGSVIKFTGDSLARGAFRPLIAPTP